MRGLLFTVFIVSSILLHQLHALQSTELRLLESQFGDAAKRRMDHFSEMSRRSVPLTDPLIRFGKRSFPIDGDLDVEMLSPLIRFGKRSPVTAADVMTRYGRRADQRQRSIDEDTMLRFGR